MAVSRKEIVIDKHSNMLIIGAGSTAYHYKEISYEDSISDVFSNYGPSPLTDAFVMAKQGGVPSIFLLNIKDNRDLLVVMDDIAQHDFTYIIPLHTYLSEYFYDTYNNNRPTLYASYMLKKLGPWAESVILMTDKHASLFEGQDAFVERMNKVSHVFDYECTSDLRRDDIVFIGNNLEADPYANLHAGISLCTTDMSVYPKMPALKPVFMIDSYDHPYNWAYFKTHADGTTTIENLLNYNAGGPDKIVTIERIVKLIKRELDLSEFEGLLYNEYQRIRMLTKISTYLSSLVGYVIDKYDVESIEPIENENHTITVLTRFSVWPINSTESCTVEKGINV